MHIVLHFDIMTCCCDNSDVLRMAIFKSIKLSWEIQHVNLFMHNWKQWKLTKVSWPLGQESTKPKAQKGATESEKRKPLYKNQDKQDKRYQGQEGLAR